MTRHGARFPDADTSSSTTGAAAGAAVSHRGVMLSMLCAFHTRRQIDEWSKSVADKYSRVDFLINFVDEEEGKRKSGSVAQDQGDSQQSDSHQQQLGEDGGSAGEYLVSSAYVGWKCVGLWLLDPDEIPNNVVIFAQNWL